MSKMGVFITSYRDHIGLTVHSRPSSSLHQLGSLSKSGASLLLDSLGLGRGALGIWSKSLLSVALPSYSHLLEHQHRNSSRHARFFAIDVIFHYTRLTEGHNNVSNQATRPPTDFTLLPASSKLGKKTQKVKRRQINHIKLYFHNPWYIVKITQRNLY